jgi:ADP-ribosylation factor-like protein 13B
MWISLWSLCKGPRKYKRHLTIVLLGIDNAGKSTVLARLKNGELTLLFFKPPVHKLSRVWLDPGSPTTATIGFSTATVQFNPDNAKQKYALTIYDVGGGPKIRGIWKNYVAEVHGVVWVVDSCDSMVRLKESAAELHKIYAEDERLQGKPLLM